MEGSLPSTEGFFGEYKRTALGFLLVIRDTATPSLSLESQYCRVVLSTATPTSGERLATVGNILGQDDISFWNAGIPIRLQIAESTVYLTRECHVFQRLASITSLHLGFYR